MKFFLSLFIASVSLVSTTEAAAEQCDGKCEIEIKGGYTQFGGGSCPEAVKALEFHGSCCALEERDGKCWLVSTGDCYWYTRGTSGQNCAVDENGNEISTMCLPAYTQYFAEDSDDPCPLTEFPLNYDAYSFGDPHCKLAFALPL